MSRHAEKCHESFDFYKDTHSQLSGFLACTVIDSHDRHASIRHELN